jgi:hypothetical protein
VNRSTFAATGCVDFPYRWSSNSLMATIRANSLLALKHYAGKLLLALLQTGVEQYCWRSRLRWSSRNNFKHDLHLRRSPPRHIAVMPSRADPSPMSRPTFLRISGAQWDMVRPSFDRAISDRCPRYLVAAFISPASNLLQ